METEEERQARRRMRIEEMKREKRRVELLRKSIGIAIAMFAGFGGCFLGMKGATIINYAAMQDGQQMQEAVGESDGTDSLAVMQAAPDLKDAQLSGEGLSEDGGVLIGEGLPEDGSAPIGKGGSVDDGALLGKGTSGDGSVSIGKGGSVDDGALLGKGTSGDGSMSIGKGASADDGALSGKDVSADGSVSIGEGMSGDDSVPDVDAVSEDGMVPEEEVVSTLGAAAGMQQLFEAHITEATVDFGSNINSLYGVVINVDDGTILAEKDAMERMNPASMTKILTVLVAAEHLREEDLDDTATITIDITDYCYINDCSVTGYGVGETITIRDLFYGTILPSGADSALALATYVAGSQEAFVELMNEKLEAMGLAETTHFTNCVGLYDEEHYSTAYDIAMILKAAVDNEFCRDVLSLHIYTTSSTEQHPDGLRVSNMFLRRIEDVDTHGEVLCAKTGYVGQAGNCAASFSVGNDGREYLCVTAGASGSKNCIADQAELYRTFIPE